MINLILHNKRAPGDCLVMEAAIHSLHTAHPGQYLTDVRCCANELYHNHPFISPLTEGREIVMEYPAIDRSNQSGEHFMQAYCDFLGSQLNIKIPLLCDSPHLYLSETEKAEFKTQPSLPYVVVNAGFKATDYTAKKWHKQGWQDLIDGLKGKLDVVQTGDRNSVHPNLNGVINMVGKTDVRKLIRICYHSVCGIGPVTFLQHLFAAINKPYVCINNREPESWLSYPKHIMLSLPAGELPCNKSPCWKSRIVPEGDNSEHDKSLCLFPIKLSTEYVCKCNYLITAEQVKEAVWAAIAGKGQDNYKPGLNKSGNRKRTALLLL